MFIKVFFEEYGVINSFLETIGFETRGSWLFSKNAFLVLVFIYVWKNCGYNVVLFLAGFNYIPKEIYEDARVNGATSFQVMRYVTIPMMRNSFFFVFVISIVNIFKSFREAYLIGGSLPHESIYMVQHFMTNNFANLNYQRLTIASLSVFSVIFLIVYLLYRRWRKEGITL
jgi:multiple sugar transport system permease protein